MIRRPPSSALSPYTTLFRSLSAFAPPGTTTRGSGLRLQATGPANSSRPPGYRQRLILNGSLEFRIGVGVPYYFSKLNTPTQDSRLISAHGRMNTLSG